jgi:hypothetical protein
MSWNGWHLVVLSGVCQGPVEFVRDRQLWVERGRSGYQMKNSRMDRDSNPFSCLSGPLPAIKFGIFARRIWRIKVYSGPEFALILP